ncbi:MAG: tRNA (adenosine(37)-N6)-threonylcarbamoyltransferase complex dimerization subunit type 1 TsaB [Candidatus Omnitrophica bacterium]|nr:tRNA (adenosine(37)-N6)-threonylcarbamoyltransferase complex dimerization subunit type 1 TsaB [Candidatus Omnitrophota bacterium]MCM8826427.1 tRNA (adenosine(37)-N6)-threonylcarbamoyltransferase complex dimerization subunit type 1 TsaB [Candidatus Omnitrophota bacterium]
MNLLGIDTSTDMVSLAMMVDNKIILDFNRNQPYGASKAIVYIKKFLNKLSIDLDIFDVFVLGAGPGSFTGLRISFSLIKAFSLALGKPVVKLGSFYSYASQVKHNASKIAIVTDAKRKMVYATTMRIKNGVIVRERREALYSLKDFIKRYRDYLFVTNSEYLRGECKNYGVEIYPKDIWPNAKELLLLTKELSPLEFTPLNRLEPIYVYPQDCQVRV